MSFSKKLIRQIRCDLLSNMTDAEMAAGNICRRLGYNVIYQHPITTGRKLYFADIYLPDIRTIIECDGGYHSTAKQRRKDGNRSASIWRLGYHVVRLSNHDARDIGRVKAKIDLILKKARRLNR